MKPKLIAVLVVIILFAVFLIQNTQVITLRLYFWRISTSQIILIPLVLLAGFVSGYVFAKLRGERRVPKNRKRSADNHSLIGR